MAVSISFRPKNRVRDKFFQTFRETFSNFAPSRKFFRRPNFFSKFSWQRCDSFGPKIVKIGAILIVFRPFEISRKFVPYKLLQNFLCGYKIEMARWHQVKTPKPKEQNSSSRSMIIPWPFHQTAIAFVTRIFYFPRSNDPQTTPEKLSIENFVKLRPAVYPPKKTRIGAKLWQNAFQTMCNFLFFDAEIFWGKKSKILGGHFF